MICESCNEMIKGRVFFDSQHRRVCYDCGDKDYIANEVARRTAESIATDESLNWLIDSAEGV